MADKWDALGQLLACLLTLPSHKKRELFKSWSTTFVHIATRVFSCGWGGLACDLAKHHSVHVTGITISNDQLKGVWKCAARDDVTRLTKFEYHDNREMRDDEDFDRGVPTATIEAVGDKSIDGCFSVVARCLKDEDGGITIVYRTAANHSIKVPIELWMLPNGVIPSIAQTLGFAERKLVVEDVHNFGPDYEKTLLC